MIMERGGLGPYRRKGFGFQKSRMSHPLPCSKNIPQKRQRALLKVKYEGATIIVYVRPRHPTSLQPEKTKFENLNLVELEILDNNSDSKNIS